jgi:urea transporter
MTYAQVTMLTTSVVGAALFFLFGPWLSDVLIGYGFAIFSPSVAQNIALFAGAALSFPSAMLFESIPVSRPWLAINGALWGIAFHVVWKSVAKLWRQPDKNHT